MGKRTRDPRTYVTKGEFAALMNRTPQAVSNSIAEGIISQRAIEGSNQRAVIWLEQARRDLNRNMSPQARWMLKKQQKRGRTMTQRRFANRAEIIAIGKLLEEHLTEPVNGIVKYKGEHSDKTIAALIGEHISDHAVAKIRSEVFGKLSARRTLAVDGTAIVALIEFVNMLATDLGHEMQLYPTEGGGWRIGKRPASGA